MTAPLHRRIRAAREYAGISRLAVARAVKVSDETIARYERGETSPTGEPMLRAIAHVTGVPDWFILEGLPAPDPATRFADAARREAERQGGHPESAPGAPGDEDVAGEGQ